MKIVSNIEIPYSAGRLGIKKGIVELNIDVYKNTENKTVTLNIRDNIKTDGVEGGIGISQHLYNSSVSLSYVEFEDLLLGIKSKKTYTETGLLLEDILVQDYLLEQAVSEKWYDTVLENWVKI